MYEMYVYIAIEPYMAVCYDCFARISGYLLYLFISFYISYISIFLILVYIFLILSISSHQIPPGVRDVRGRLQVPPSQQRIHITLGIPGTTNIIKDL